MRDSALNISPTTNNHFPSLESERRCEGVRGRIFPWSFSHSLHHPLSAFKPSTSQENAPYLPAYPRYDRNSHTIPNAVHLTDSHTLLQNRARFVFRPLHSLHLTVLIQTLLDTFFS